MVIAHLSSVAYTQYLNFRNRILRPKGPRNGYPVVLVLFSTKSCSQLSKETGGTHFSTFIPFGLFSRLKILPVLAL